MSTRQKTNIHSRVASDREQLRPRITELQPPADEPAGMRFDDICIWMDNFNMVVGNQFADFYIGLEGTDADPEKWVAWFEIGIWESAERKAGWRRQYEDAVVPWDEAMGMFRQILHAAVTRSVAMRIEQGVDHPEDLIGELDTAIVILHGSLTMLSEDAHHAAKLCAEVNAQVEHSIWVTISLADRLINGS